MYDISHFKANNHQEVIDFMQANPFVTICGVDAKGFPVASHIPVLIKVENEKITRRRLGRGEQHAGPLQSLSRQEVRAGGNHLHHKA